MRVASLNRIEYDHRVYLLPPGQIHYGEEKQIDQKRRQQHDKPVFHEEGNIQSQPREEAEKGKIKEQIQENISIWVRDKQVR